MNSMLIIPPLFGMAGLLVALFIYFVVLKYDGGTDLSLIHISEPTRLGMISYAVFC